MRRLLKVCLALALVVLTIAIVIVAGAYFMLRRSLPSYDRDATIPSLSAPVTVERDELAIPTIRAATQADAARALGFVHAQDRLFQMDLARRYAAGRLAELIGADVVEVDKGQRRFQFDKVAREVFMRLPEHHRELLQAYAEGVNAAIDAMPARPPAYLILRTRPAPWRAEDCLLVNFAMHLDLSRYGNNELSQALLRRSFPPEMVEFLSPQTTRFDAPLIESGQPPAQAPIPGPDVIDVHKGATGTQEVPAPKPTGPSSTQTTSEHPTRSSDMALAMHDGAPLDLTADPLTPGSNSFAVSGKRTADGRAIVENDMHLGFSAPNIWYRADIRWGDEQSGGAREGGKEGAEPHHAVGVTLPGVPGIIVGSNTHVAWGFTNVTGDFLDYILVETLPDDPERYRTPEGSEPFTTITETIDVRAGAPVTFTMRATRWGPVFDTDDLGRPLVCQWTATDPERNNLAILDMAMARSLQEAIDVARAWHGPPQNVVLASADGRIAWVLAGDIPLRRGFDGDLPTPRTDPDVGWFGSVPEERRPVLIDPPSGLLYTANNRTIPLSRAAAIGHNWAPPYRAYRIRELLEPRRNHDEASLLAIALDTRLEAYDFYRDLVLNTIPANEPDSGLAAIRAAVEQWDGHANVDSIALPFLIRFRNELVQSAIGGIYLSKLLSFTSGTGSLNDDETLRRLLEERPENLLGPMDPSWDALIRRALAAAASDVRKTYPKTGLATRWGVQNRAHIKSPLTLGIQRLVPLLDMPADPLAGHPWCVRVMAPTFGASERLVVSPGHEDEAILEMPTGQCEHPLSRHYRDMQRAYLRGDPTPLLPGPPMHTMTLSPPAGAPSP